MVAVIAHQLEIRIHDLIAPEKCFDFLRKERWPQGICCPACTSNRVKKNGHKDCKFSAGVRAALPLVWPGRLAMSPGSR